MEDLAEMSWPAESALRDAGHRPTPMLLCFSLFETLVWKSKQIADQRSVTFGALEQRNVGSAGQSIHFAIGCILWNHLCSQMPLLLSEFDGLDVKIDGQGVASCFLFTADFVVFFWLDPSLLCFSPSKTDFLGAALVQHGEFDWQDSTSCLVQHLAGVCMLLGCA